VRLPSHTPAASAAPGAENRGQCRLPLAFSEFRGKPVHLSDVLAAKIYDRDGSDLVDIGLYIDHTLWHFNLFALQTS
jgi:hypothetical protein